MPPLRKNDALYSNWVRWSLVGGYKRHLITNRYEMGTAPIGEVEWF
jgi:hypothetical protein